MKCLDCGKKRVQLRRNPGTGIFEGFRLCKSCRQSEKRKYLE
jgi:hypothetical protein